MTCQAANSFRFHAYRLTRSSALTAALLVLPSIAYALPTGGDVTHGTAGISTVGSVTTIQQDSAKAVINWNQFNVNNGETVRFNQPSVSAITLNRVVADANPSQILGAIQANGRVIISNPNGMVFGPQARIDVGGLIATTANINSNQFMNNDRLRFNTAGAQNARIEVQNGAQIVSTAQEQGLVALVAPQVINQGIISANQGKVLLAGAEKATLDLTGDGLVNFAVSNENSAAQVSVGGQVQARGGQIYLTAQAASNVVNQVINTQGIVDAGDLVATPNGLVLVEGSVSASAEQVGGRVEVTGRDVVVRGSGALQSNGQTAGTVRVTADRHAIIGGGVGNTRLSANSSSKLKGTAGRVQVLAKGGDAALLSNASISADGYRAGRIDFSGADILLAGALSVDNFGGRLGSIVIDPAQIIINNGGFNGLVNNIAEQWIEAQSQAGSNVTLEATDLIRMDNLADNVLQGGAGNITLRTLGANGEIRFASKGDTIRTTSGDVTLSAGAGGINIGSIATGINGAYPALGAPNGDVAAGTIRLATTNGGNIDVRNLTVRGTRDDSSIIVDSSGAFTARALSVRIDDRPEPGSAGRATIDVLAEDDISITGNVVARSRDLQDANRIASAFISLISTTGDVTANSQVTANAQGGLLTPFSLGSSEAIISVSGTNVNLSAVQANARGGHDALSEVTLTATNQLITRDDVLSLAQKTVSGVGDSLGTITMTANSILVPITNLSTAIRATTDVLINGAVRVTAPEDAIVLTGTPTAIQSSRSLNINGGKSVTALGGIQAFLANLDVRAGSGGISLGSLTTGDALLVANDVLNQVNGAFEAGNITLTSTQNGSISTGAISSAGTFGTTRITLVSDEDVTTGPITLIGEDGPQAGSVDLMAISINADDQVLINGDILLRGEDRQDATRRGEVTLNVAAGGDLTVTGNVEVLARGGLRSSAPGDSGTTFAEAFFDAGNDLTLGNVLVESMGGTDASAYLFMGAPNGRVALGDTVSRAQSSTSTQEGDPVVGVANATLEIVALGTSSNSAANITYNGANPLAVANLASRQGRFTSTQNVAGNIASLLIVNDPGGPVPPVSPPETPSVTPPAAPSVPLVSDLLEEIELNRLSSFARNLYSFFGETAGDQYYFGNTEVNLSLLTPGRVTVPTGVDAAALANLSPAAGGANQNKALVRPRLTGGSDAKRARYAWASSSGTSSNGSGQPTEGITSPEGLAGLSPAAGGEVANNLNTLNPQGGVEGSCGNYYLDAGYGANFDASGCQ